MQSLHTAKRPYCSPWWIGLRRTKGIGTASSGTWREGGEQALALSVLVIFCHSSGISPPFFARKKRLPPALSTQSSPVVSFYSSYSHLVPTLPILPRDNFSRLREKKIGNIIALPCFHAGGGERGKMRH